MDEDERRKVARLAASEAAQQFLRLRSESRNVDFKRGCAWKDLGSSQKEKLCKHIAAMANSGGGEIFIGFADGTFHCDGLVPADHGFDLTDVGNCMRSLFDPDCECQVHEIEDGGHLAIWIRVRDFELQPLITIDQVAGHGKGTLFVRTNEARSTVASSALEVRRLLEEAARKIILRYGYVMASSSQSIGPPQVREQEEAEAFFDQQRARLGLEEHAIPGLICEVRIQPQERPAYRLSQGQLKKAVEAAEKDYRGWPVLHLHDGEHEQPVRDGRICDYGRAANQQNFFYWYLRRDGLFYQAAHTSENFYERDDGYERVGPREPLFDPVTRILEFSEELATFCRLYRELGFPDDHLLKIEYSWFNAVGRLYAYRHNPMSPVLARGVKRVVPFEPEIQTELPVGTLPEGVHRYVVDLFQRLNQDIAPDFEIQDSLVEEWSRKCIERRL